MRRITTVGAATFALALMATPAVADDTPDYGVTTTTLTENDECGTFTVTWTNPTDWEFFGDYRIGNEQGTPPDEELPETIAEGPLAGEPFGPTYHLTSVPPGSVDVEGDATNAVQQTIKVPDGTEPVTVRAWIKRGPEQHSFSMATPIEVMPCEPADSGNGDDTGEDTSDGDHDSTSDDDSTSNGTSTEDDKQSTGDSGSKSETNGDGTTSKHSDDGDSATDDGLAPQPTPAPAHIAVTG